MTLQRITGHEQICSISLILKFNGRRAVRNKKCPKRSLRGNNETVLRNTGIYVRIYICVCVYLYMWICICVYMYTFMCVIFNFEQKEDILSLYSVSCFFHLTWFVTCKSGLTHSNAYMGQLSNMNKKNRDWERMWTIAILRAHAPLSFIL